MSMFRCEHGYLEGQCPKCDEARSRAAGGSLSMTAHTMANRIRIMAFQCKSKDVLSCDFGNEFGQKVEEFLKHELEALGNNKEIKA